MILEGNARGNAGTFARHLLNGHDNEHVEVHEVAGFMSEDLTQALHEIEAIARGTKCQKTMFSVSLNPPIGADATNEDFEDAIAKIEASLKLEGQPRAIVFHEKEGRRHAHCVWSRIDVETHKAIQLPYYKMKLMEISRQLYMQHGWDMPNGFKDKSMANPLNMSREEWQQAKRVMDDPVLLKQIFKECWEQSDNKESFEQALREHGLFLARGDKRGFVAVDVDGTPYSLSRWTGVKAKDLTAKLGDQSDLPSIEEVKQTIADLMPEKMRETVAQHKEQMALHAVKRERTPAELIDIITHHHAAFDRRMMERSLYRYFDEPAKMRSAISDLIASGKLIRLEEKNGQAFYSTKEMQKLEQNLIARAESMANKPSHALQKAHKTDAITTFNKKLLDETNGAACLSNQQLAAIYHLTDKSQLSSLVGVAGAGKTTIMQVVSDAYTRQGYRVRGAALSGIAAGGLKESGINAGTLHALEMQIKAAENMKRQQSWHSLSPKQQDFINNTLLTKHDVLIIDEAGMVGARQLDRVMTLAQKAGAKVILCGDHEQLQSIEAGAAFRTIIERNGYADIREVRRQSTQWMRDATIQFSEGKTTDALQAYQEKQHVHHEKDKDAAISRLVDDYMASRKTKPEQSRMVLAYTKKDVAALNQALKTEMVKAGFVNGKNTPITTSRYEQDEEIIEKQGFAIGDRIMFRENNKQMGVMNGTLATITNIDRHIVDVKLDNGQDLRFNTQEYNKFQLGYAATVHKSQGVTVDQAYVLASKHFDRHTTYVAMTRHKHNVQLYAGKDEFRSTHRLMSSLGKDGQKLSTLDFETERTVKTKMGNRRDQLVKHKQALTRHHRKERDALAEAQKQRRQQEQKARKDQQPKGLRAVWSRVTGKNDKMRETIEKDIAKCNSRDALEKHNLVRRHLYECQQLQQQIDSFRHDARQELTSLRQDVSKILETGYMPEHLTVEAQMQYNQNHQQDMGL